MPKSTKPYRHTSGYYRKIKNIKNRESHEYCISSQRSHEQLACTATDDRASSLLELDILTQNCGVSPFDTGNHANVDDEDAYQDYIEMEIIEKKKTLTHDLTCWALAHKIAHSAANDLLKILRSNGIDNIPNDARTLLQTPRIIEIIEMGTGKFWYNGIKSSLMNVFREIQSPKSIYLIFNVDGISPFKSSSLQFWPILFIIDNMRHLQPMTAAIYYGENKPPLQLYLQRFVEELKEILENGFCVNGHQVFVKVKCFVCDTPARSFIKGTPGSNAENGSCIKCTVVGEWDKKGRHMSYPRVDSTPRTDYSFRQKIDEDHHKEDTPLTKLPIDMVKDFVVADSLHLFELGIMRKYLFGWREGNYNFRTKFSKNQADVLSQMLEECNKTKPVEIQRAIRGLKFLKFWKGSEYRIVLLYVGIVVLKDVLTTEVYEHFLLLSTAATILYCQYHMKYVDIAGKLLDEYIEKFIEIYGIDSVSSNVHNLCHVLEDVKRLGPLSEISSYPFENYLGYLKSLVRSGNVPLSQISRRIVELSRLDVLQSETRSDVYLTDKVSNEDHEIKFCKYVYRKLNLPENVILCNDKRNRYFLTQNEEVVVISNFTYMQEKIQIFGSALQKTEDFFLKPFASSRLSIFGSTGENYGTALSPKYKFKMNQPKLYGLNEFKCKLFCMQYHDKFVFVPLLHTYIRY